MSLLPLALLAGGLATRLRPLTDRVPKALLPVAGRPFIFHQLELLQRQGIEHVVLCLAHRGDQIRAAVSGLVLPGLRLSYSFDGETLRGTGGALRAALPLLGEEFFVLNGDSYLPCSLQQIQAAYRAAQRPALMTVMRNDDRWDRSNVLMRGGRLLRYDKRAPQPGMSHIDFGLSVLSRAVLAPYAAAEVLDLADVLHALSLQGELAAFEVRGRFYEIGSLRGLKDTEEFLLREMNGA